MGMLMHHTWLEQQKQAKKPESVREEVPVKETKEPEKVDPAEETPDPEPEKAEETPEPEPEADKGGGVNGVS